MSTMEPTSSAVAKPAEKPALGRYHLLVLAFFVLSWLAQYAAFSQYSPFIPEKIRGLLQAIFYTAFAVNSGFYVSLVPLGIVFIFCWLYLMDVRADIRKLYQIVVLSIVPIIALMLGLLIYTTLFMRVDSSAGQGLNDVFNSLLQNPQQNTVDPALKAQMDELVKAREQSLSFIKPYWVVAGVLSCLVCGHLLYRRMKLAAWKAILIPASFAIAIVVVRTLTTSGSGSGSLIDRLKEVVQP